MKTSPAWKTRPLSPTCEVPSSLVEQWRFPLGDHCATLTITSDPGCEIGPEDMDALFEIGLLFKASILRRYRERSARIGVVEYEI